MFLKKMKRFFASFFLLFLFFGLSPVHAAERALFVSVIQEPPVLENRRAIQELVEFSKKSGIKTLFVQVYRANRAWFRSEFADDTPYEASLEAVGEDPLDLLIRQAHGAGIEVHAWLNLLSLSANAEAPFLKKYGPEILTRNRDEKKSLEDYKIDDQLFLEAGDPRVVGDLSLIVEELVRAYPNLDGLQFDYIRYPDWHPDYGWTKINVVRFKKETGRDPRGFKDIVWENWKRSQVTTLLETLAKKARQIHPAVQVSTTALAPYSRAYFEGDQDWKSWLEKGTVDFITLMGYATDSGEFERRIADAKKTLGSLEKVNLAIGAYAMESAPQIFKNQLKICEESGSRACVVLHYGNLMKNSALAESLGAADPVFFRSDSVWNKKLSRDQPIHPNSENFVRELLKNLHKAKPGINAAHYSTPLYRVNSTTPKSPVRIVQNGRPQTETVLGRECLKGVPLPQKVRAADGTDGHLTILETDTGKLYEFWKFKKVNSRWQASWGGILENVKTSDGIMPRVTNASGGEEAWGATATGLPVIAGTILIEELKTGKIPHALAFAIPRAKKGKFIWPARRTDGTTSAPNAIPEGARFRLPEDIPMDPRWLPLTRMLVEAVRDYGMILRDQAGAVVFYGEDPTPTGSDPYRDMKPTEAMEQFPWEKLQALDF